MSAQKTTNSKMFNICNNKIETYYYTIGRKFKKYKYTPYKTRIIETALHEGEYHPICKIQSLPNINITENEITDDDLVIYNSKKPKDIKKITSQLHISIITCQYYSLFRRYQYDLMVMKGNIDKQHLKAGLYTIDLINKSLEVLYHNVPNDLYNCVLNDLEKEFGNITDIYNFYSNPRKPRSLKKLAL
uniref:Uncharacterized protein n=1 Tax=viral metagenome TaxID=1070528 RepID=A0A6C0I8D7_9ZZZZ